MKLVCHVDDAGTHELTGAKQEQLFAMDCQLNNRFTEPKNLMMAELCSVFGLWFPLSQLVKVLLSTPKSFRHSTAVIFKSNLRFLICSPIFWGLAGYWLDFHK